ncbi:MAG: histidine kinase [Lachnospiraceae bacterium]|nr:histidine kinase [Lachnospiraceae bacterium]
MLDKILTMGSGELLLAVRELDREDDNKSMFQERLCIYTKMGNLNGSDCLLEMSMPLEKMLNMQGMELPEGSILGVCLQLDDETQTLLLSTDTKEAEGLLNEYHQTGEVSGYYPCVSRVDGLSGSQVTCLLPKTYVAKLIRGNLVNFIVIIGIFLLTILACSYIVATMLTARITRSIEKMNSELDTILTKPLTTVLGDSDFEGIEQRIHKLIQGTQEYYTRLEQYESEKNRLELELLQMRFNPHLLYNTLGSIRYQVKDCTIAESIDSLVHYYRIILSKGHLLIQIEEEIAMIQEYLNVEIFTYQLHNVKVVFDVSEDVKSYTIIKHLLQPIVENALEHGVRASEDGGTIWIRAMLEGRDVVFEIEDSGAGMTPEQMEQVLTEPAKSGTGGGYGIYNVQQRVQTYYGDAYGLNFESRIGQGTCVTLRIPQSVEVDG